MSRFSLAVRRYVSRFRLAVRRYAGKKRDLGSNPLRLSSLFKSWGLWTLSCVFVIHYYETLKWLSSLPILMQELFWWWQCSDRHMISLFPHLHTPFPFSPSPISLMVSVDVKHPVYLLAALASCCWRAFFLLFFVCVWGEGGEEFYDCLYSAILRPRADSLRSHVIQHEWLTFYSAFLNIHRSGVTWNCCRLGASSVHTIQPCTMSLHAKPHT